MTIEERKQRILAQIADMIACGKELQLNVLDEAYKKGVDCL